jgi:hypothetical protein
MAKGVLIAAMDFANVDNGEFNDWYDTEHLPQRLALPGFLSGSRWVCIDGWPRWLALYDLASSAAVHSDAYLGVSGAHSTPWSRRILPRTVGRSRITAVALDGEPGAAPIDPRRTSRLIVMGVPPGPPGSDAGSPRSIAARVRDVLSARDGVLQVRAFIDPDATLWLLAAFDAPVTSGSLAAEIGRPCGAGAAAFNLYVPYQRSFQ